MTVFSVGRVLCDAGRMSAASIQRGLILFRKVLGTLNETQPPRLHGRTEHSCSAQPPESSEQTQEHP